jgi:uncharacterized Zn finger protein (UPF0148 family)
MPYLLEIPIFNFIFLRRYRTNHLGSLKKLFNHVYCQKCNAYKVLVPASISCPVCDAPPYVEQFAARAPTKKKCPKCKSQLFIYPADIACPVCDKAPRTLSKLPKQPWKVEIRSTAETPSIDPVEQLHPASQPRDMSGAKILVGGTLLSLVVVGIIFILAATISDIHTQNLRALNEAKSQTAAEAKAAKEKTTQEAQATNAQSAAEAQTTNGQMAAVQQAATATTSSATYYPQYKSVLGQIFPGIALYTKDTHSPFGFVVDVEPGYVWVADSYTTDSANIQLYARKYERRFITDNFVTKK